MSPISFAQVLPQSQMLFLFYFFPIYHNILILTLFLCHLNSTMGQYQVRCYSCQNHIYCICGTIVCNRLWLWECIACLLMLTVLSMTALICFLNEKGRSVFILPYLLANLYLMYVARCSVGCIVVYVYVCT